jgi:hypothetical protein
MARMMVRRSLGGAEVDHTGAEVETIEHHVRCHHDYDDHEPKGCHR